LGSTVDHPGKVNEDITEMSGVIHGIDDWLLNTDMREADLLDVRDKVPLFEKVVIGKDQMCIFGGLAHQWVEADDQGNFFEHFRERFMMNRLEQWIPANDEQYIDRIWGARLYVGDEILHSEIDERWFSIPRPPYRRL